MKISGNICKSANLKKIGIFD